MLKNKKIFLFDIDGTLSIDERVYEGTRELLSYIESIGGFAFYITNNSSKSQKDYVEKFKRMGIKSSENQFITAGYAACLYMQQHFRDKKVYVLGTKSFVEEIEKYGVRIAGMGEENVDAVLVAFDQELTYEKVKEACRHLVNPEVAYIATNADLRCPTEFGFVPDCAAICGMIGAAVEREPFYVGKPNPMIVEMCLSQVKDAKKEEVLVVGDRLYTDIACGINAQVDTAVVFTGEARKEDMEETPYQAEWQFDTIKDLYEAVLKKKERR